MKIDKNGATLFLHLGGGIAAVCVGFASLMVGWASLHHYQDSGSTVRVNVLTNDVVVCSARYGCSTPVEYSPPDPEGPSPYQRRFPPSNSQMPN